jgi:hypothetical protein
LIGELEATFTMTACRTANVEWMMHRPDLQRYVKPLVESFCKVSNEDHRGTRLADENHFPPNKPPQEVTLDTQIHETLIRLIGGTSTAAAVHPPPNVLELEKISISGVIYASEKSLPRDSNIIFRRPGGSSSRAGRIKSIFQSDYQTGVTFLVVSQYKLIAAAHPQNIYRRFGFAGGFLCDAEEDKHLFVVRTNDVVCHFARTTLIPREDNLMHVLPMNSVCSLRWVAKPALTRM